MDAGPSRGLGRFHNWRQMLVLYAVRWAESKVSCGTSSPFTVIMRQRSLLP